MSHDEVRLHRPSGAITYNLVMPETTSDIPQQPTRPRKWKRTATAALLLLVGGAIVNVAVAWGLSFDRGMYDIINTIPSVFPSHGALDLETRRFWGGVVHARPGRVGVETIVSWDLDEMMEMQDATEAEIISRLEMMRNEGLGELPSWSAVRSFRSVAAEPIGEFRHYQILSDRAFGWPTLAMSCFWRLHTDEEAAMYRRTLRYGLALTALDSPMLAQPGMSWFLQVDCPWVVPLRVLLPGFIINTLFYALLLWLLFFAPFTARRMLRRRRGLCEKCAYPIGVSPVCTECGAAVPRKVEA